MPRKKTDVASAAKGPTSETHGEPGPWAEDDPLRLLAWAVERFHPRIALTSSFGLEDVVLSHLARSVRPGFPVFFIDTGFHLPETLALRDRLVRQWGLNVTTFHPDLSVLAQDSRHGERLFQREPDRCCAIRKVAPMRRALTRLDAWVTGMRRAQSATRRHLQAVEEHVTAGGRTIVKLNPLVAWDLDRVKAYARHHDLPYNPLHDHGYPSIGCFPCTRAVAPGEGARAGRWAGHEKVECGLHELTLNRSDGGETA